MQSQNNLETTPFLSRPSQMVPFSQTGDGVTLLCPCSTTCWNFSMRSKGSLSSYAGEERLDNIEGRFISENFTFDVYVTKDRRIKLIDFNPWCASTLQLLFTWEELEQGGMGEEDVDFRIVESQLTVRPGMKTAVPYYYNRYEPWESIFKECQ